MPLQQISVSPLEKNWGKECSNRNNHHDWKLQETVFATSGSNPPERRASQASSLSNGHDICRICHCEGDNEVPLIAPCYCSGSLRYVHQACLQQWIKSSDIRSCELCKFQFIMHSKIKPFNEWETLEMSGVERRKILCSVTFHAVALTCVVWSLYVLIDRTAEEMQQGQLEWPFWTKLIVVAIGFTGGIVFMYIQCKAYLLLCRRWRAFNRVIFVQNAPEKLALPSTRSQAPAVPSENTVTDVCCGGLTAQNHDKLREIVSVSPSSVYDHKKESASSLKEEKLFVSSASAAERGRDLDCEELLKNVLEENQSSYPSIDVNVVSRKQSNSDSSYDVASRVDLNERKFSADEPSGECGELSQLLHCEDTSHQSQSTGGQTYQSPGFVLLPTTLSPSSTRQQVLSPSSSEESFVSSSVRLLESSSVQKPWIIGPPSTNIMWASSEPPLCGSLGSQSPLIAKPVTDNASSTK